MQDVALYRYTEYYSRNMATAHPEDEFEYNESDIRSSMVAFGADVRRRSRRSRCKLYMKWIMGSVSVEFAVFIWMLCVPWLANATDSFYFNRLCTMVSDLTEGECSEALQHRSLGGHAVFRQTIDSWWYYRRLITDLTSVISTVILGIYADIVGICLPFYMPFLGQILACIFYIALMHCGHVNVGYALFGEVLMGLGGGTPTIVMAALSYLSKMDEENYRTIRFVIMYSSMGLGTGISYLLPIRICDSQLYALEDIWMASYTGVIVASLIAILYSWLRFGDYEVYETDITRCRWNPLSVLTTTFQGFPSLRHAVLVLLGFTCLASGVNQIEIITMYFDQLTISRIDLDWVMAYKTLLQSLAAVGIILLMKYKLKVSDINVARLGLVSAAIEYGVFGLSSLVLPYHDNTEMIFFYAAPIGGTLSLFSTVCLVALIAGLTKETDNHGKLFAFITSFESVLQLASAVAHKEIFQATSDTGVPTIIFWIAASISGFTLIISCTCQCWFACAWGIETNSLLTSEEDSVIVDDPWLTEREADNGALVEVRCVEEPKKSNSSDKRHNWTSAFIRRQGSVEEDISENSPLRQRPARPCVMQEDSPIDVLENEMVEHSTSEQGGIPHLTCPPSRGHLVQPEERILRIPVVRLDEQLPNGLDPNIPVQNVPVQFLDVQILEEQVIGEPVLFVPVQNVVIEVNEGVPEPEALPDDRELFAVDPERFGENQEPMDDDHESMDDDHESMDDDHESMDDDLESVDDDTEPLDDDPEPLDDDPEPLDDDPEPLDDDPEPLGDDPEPLDDDPEPLDDDPEPVDNGPEAVGDARRNRR